MEIQENVELKDYATFKIGGSAKYFCIAKSTEDLQIALHFAKEKKLKFFVLGGGSNLLISDKGFGGLVIKLKFESCKVNKNKISVDAGLSLSKLVHLALDNSLSGMDWASGIPGSVGGAIYGNAQAFGTKISDNIKEVEYLDVKSLKVKKAFKKQCAFTLKNSIFKKNKDLIVLSAIFELKKGNKEEIRKNVLEHINYRKKNHPISFASAGSVFVNTEKKITNKNLLAKFPELKYFNSKGAIPSGYLIERVGLSGKQIGGAKFSDIHANFIVNTGSAKAEDVLKLIKLAKQKVKKVFNINLETEIQLMGF
jgi:UDP-N-acetylmuramate dehydrogenase